MANRTVGAIATDKPRCLDGLLGTVGMAKSRDNVLRGRGELHELDGALDLYVPCVQKLIEHAFGIALRNHERVRICSLDTFERETRNGVLVCEDVDRSDFIPGVNECGAAAGPFEQLERSTP